jgi:hypothetical protein
MTALRFHTVAPALTALALCATTPALASAQADSSPIRVHSPGVTGDLRLHLFTSKVFGNARYLRVLVPDGYDAPENRGRHYPVLYSPTARISLIPRRPSSAHPNGVSTRRCTTW